ncbi:unnamed protein product [Protopolystoma xenopodis]|uniref:Uncharacterized protein n=1 Tax=Protopolystoma xenopodis TaxID=117903 RepID=A0A3S5CP39_9PLAT|nr:unnamed protein product [Protopolystoma xenopodis]
MKAYVSRLYTTFAPLTLVTAHLYFGVYHCCHGYHLDVGGQPDPVPAAFGLYTTLLDHDSWLISGAAVFELGSYRPSLLKPYLSPTCCIAVGSNSNVTPALAVAFCSGRLETRRSSWRGLEDSKMAFGSGEDKPCGRHVEAPPVFPCVVDS